MRPQFIPRELFRSYFSRGELNKLLRIDGIMGGSYVDRCERAGKPLPFSIWRSQKRWRPIDLVARARADALSIEPSAEDALLRDIDELCAVKEALTAEISARKHELSLQTASTRLTGATLLTEAEIADGRLDLPVCSGVYFLLRGNRVVYVGQSVSIFRRLADHTSTKNFDGFSYIQCDVEKLDVLESLYIHVLRPELNGKGPHGQGMAAPLRLDALISA